MGEKDDCIATVPETRMTFNIFIHSVKSTVIMFIMNVNIPVNPNAPVVERQQILVQAPPEAVWQVLADINHWPEWQSAISEAQLKGDLAEGTAFDWKAGGIPFKSVIHTARPGNSFGWTGKTFGASAIHNWQFEGAEGGTLVSVEESLQGFLPALLKGKFRKDLKKGMLENLLELKARAEAANI
jgi:hypothetical protein